MDTVQSQEPSEPTDANLTEATVALLDEPNPKPRPHATVAEPDGWPTAPRSARSGAVSLLSDLLVDVLLLALSAVFLAFAVAVWCLNDSAVSEHSSTVKLLLELPKYRPSVFPILFACVIGRATHAIRVWRLQTGEFVGVLDLLAGSTSPAATVFSQFGLGIKDIEVRHGDVASEGEIGRLCIASVVPEAKQHIVRPVQKGPLFM